jgi:arsenate reductase
MSFMPVEIWHNPACSKSRAVLALIRQAGIEPWIVDYLRQPPDAGRLREAIAAAGLAARDALRASEPAYRAMGLDAPALPDEALLAAMAEVPALINRPFVFTPLGVRLCRPEPEVVLEILPPR